MALTAYTNVYSTKAYQERVSDIGAAITGIQIGYWMNYAKSELEKQIQAASKAEEKILKLLGAKNMADLNKKIERFNTAVCHLSGPAMMERYARTQQSAQTDSDFDKSVREWLKTDFFDYWDKNTGKTLEEIWPAFLNEVFNRSGKNQFRSARGVNLSALRGTRDVEKLLVPHRLTPDQRNALKDHLKVDTRVKSTFVVEPTNDGMSLVFEWYNISDPDERKKQFTDDIVNTATVDDQTMLRAIIDKMLLINPKMFDITSADGFKSLSGILGEIQGIYYITKLVGIENLEKILWLGPQLREDTRKQYSRDILFEGFGIQVKNTGSDFPENKYLTVQGFSKLKLNELLNRLSEYGLSNNARDLFANYFGTRAFNVPYKIIKDGNNKTTYVEASESESEDFNTAYKRLQGYQNDINILMSIFASVLLHLNAGLQNNDDVNTLFIIGGASIVSAKEILLQVQQSLANWSTSSLRTSFLTGNSYNIVTALQSDRNLRKQKYKEGYDGNDQYSQQILNNITLSTSYTFKYHK